MINLYEFYSYLIGRQPVAQLDMYLENEYMKLVSRYHFAQIPWGHNILILTKIKELDKVVFYIQKTIENGWSRNVLALQIKSDLYARSAVKSMIEFNGAIRRILIASLKTAKKSLDKY